MRFILLSAFAAATLTASALQLNVGARMNQSDIQSETIDNSTFKGKYRLDRTGAVQKEIIDQYAVRRAAAASDADEALITDPQGKKTRYAMSVNIFLSGIGSTHVGGFGAEAVTSDDGSTFYSKAFTLNFFQQGCASGTMDGDSIVFHSGEYVYDTKDSKKAYMYAAYIADGEDWPDLVDTFTLRKDEKGRYVSDPGNIFMVMTREAAEGGINEDTDIICFGMDYVFTPLPDPILENTLPADAELFTCKFGANSLSNIGGNMVMDVTVGVKNDSIYIGGLSDYLPDSYLTGRINADNTITFNTKQYIGYHDKGDYPYIYEFAMTNPFYCDGESLYFGEAESVSMTFNDEHTLLSLEEDAGIFVTAYGDFNSWCEAYWNIRMGDLFPPQTPREPADVSCYTSSYSAPYVTFEWSSTGKEGQQMAADSLWCEFVVNGEPYTFLPEYYEGLEEATDRIYYSLSGVNDIYPGDFSSIYLKEYEGKSDELKTIGLRIGYQSNGETRYSDLVYARGYEPFEDKAFVPSQPTGLVFYKDYYNNIIFNFDGKDTEGSVIPDRLLGVEILLDGEPLRFKDSDYYFYDGQHDDVTIIGLSEFAPNYSYSLVEHAGDKYIISLWGHSEIPAFKTIAVRAACYGSDTITYGETCELDLERPAVPAKPENLVYDDEQRTLSFEALPVDIEGNGLAPWNYGYEVFVNGALYTFPADMYDLENDITVIPYEGFEYNYNFYLHTDIEYDETDWSLKNKTVVLDVAMLDANIAIGKIGVRAVYTDADGKTTYSEIAGDGTTGIETVSTEKAPVRWFNIQGIEVDTPVRGGMYLRSQNGSTRKVYIR